MGKLIDADICLEKAWQNFYKQEDEHEKNIDDYDILRDRFYEQSGFECCQQAIVNAQPVEAIPKDQYENRLKAELDKVRAKIAEHGSIWVEYKITGKRDKDIEQLVIDVLKQAKKQVLEILDKYKGESEET